jgi:hypothetical protein
MKVVFIAGPYRAATVRGIVENIRRAEAVAIEVWKLGAAALCPHLCTALFDGVMPDEVWLNGALELLRRCDAVVLVHGWSYSQGTLNEITAAQGLGLPVFDDLAKLNDWLAEQGVPIAIAEKSLRRLIDDAV